MRSLILSLLCLLQTVDSYKILVYNPKFGHSHVKFMGSVADVLASRGHTVVSLIPDMDPLLEDCTKNTTIIRVERSEETGEIVNSLFHNENINFFAMPLQNYMLPFTVGPLFTKMFGSMCKTVIETPGLIERLREEKFDVMINENFDYCGTGISHLIEAKSLITASSTGLFENVAEDIGIPYPTSYVPAFFTEAVNENSMWSRLMNTMNSKLAIYFHNTPKVACQKVFREAYGNDFPDLVDITARSALLITNQEPVLDYAYPTLKKIVDLGGISALEPKPIKEPWLDILSLRPRTVLISFGSIAKSKTMPDESKRGILKTISSMPDITFIWKYEDLNDSFALTEAPSIDNLLLTEWMPQNDLLADPRVVAFVSHAGAGSALEAAQRGVPTLFVPIFAEQPRNGGMMAKTGMAAVYSKFELHKADKLTKAIKNIVESEEMHHAAQRVSQLLKSRPFSPTELLIKNVEFIASTGPIESFYSKSAELSFITLHNLDLFALFALIFVAISFSLLLCLRAVIRIKVKVE